MIAEQFSLFDTPEVEMPEWQRRLTQFKKQPAPAPAPALNRGPKGLLRIGATAKKLDTLADKMQAAIDACFADRQTNTPKRLGQAMSKRAEGERLKRTQSAMRALAALHRGDGCPASLAGLTSKKAIHDLMAAKMEQVPNGYHSYYVDSGKPRDEASPEALQLWALLSEKSEEEQRADELRQAIEGLQFSKIPGYFPTPPAVVDLMLDYAQIELTHKVLEPSAGHGAIVDKIPECAAVVVCEVNHTLCDILRMKGFDARPTDFFEMYELAKFDRILMNPPFEKQADIAHVFHAFDHLKPGGRLVSVMSASPFFRTDKRSTEFQRFIEERGGEVVDLPEGAFKESGTGVNTKLVIIDKE